MERGAQIIDQDNDTYVRVEVNEADNDAIQFGTQGELRAVITPTGRLESIPIPQTKPLPVAH